MRKAALVAAVAMGLGLAGAPAVADEESDSMDVWYREACEMMIWQFDGARARRQNHPNFASALALRDQGAARCDNAEYNEGSVLMRTALQSIDVYPLY